MALSAISVRRKKMMDHLINCMNLLDPSGENAKLMRARYSKMSDAEFDKEMEEFFADEHEQFYLELIEFERDLTIEAIEECAAYMGVPLCERVAVPYVNYDLDNIVVTPTSVPVGYIHEKRMPQSIIKKNSGSINIKKRNAKTGQVTGEDKNARNSDMETYSMIAMGANNTLREFMGPRADDLKAKSEMENFISKNGYVSQADLTNDPENKVALNSLDVYFLMQGFVTNLVSPMTVLPSPKSKD